MRVLLAEASLLPPPAVPFIRELLLAIARSVPPTFGPPPRFEAAGLRDAQGCAEAAAGLLDWLKTVSDLFGERVEEMEAVFRTLLGVIQRIDGQIHRAVVHSKHWVEEDMTFNRSVQDVLRDVLDGIDGQEPQCAERLRQVTARLEAKGRADRGGTEALSAQFRAVGDDLGELRARVAEVEERTRRLRDQSLRDPLTGVWNRRAFDARFAEESARATRYRQPLALVLWDLDRFKAVNDAHGHQAGDLVLQALVGRVAGLLRSCDFVARVGGEEFVAVLPNTDLSKARVAAEKIRAGVASMPVNLPAGPVQLTTSLGVAALQPGETPSSLFARADEALYRAKAAGRNRAEADGN